MPDPFTWDHSFDFANLIDDYTFSHPTGLGSHDFLANAPKTIKGYSR